MKKHHLNEWEIEKYKEIIVKIRKIGDELLSPRVGYPAVPVLILELLRHDEPQHALAPLMIALEHTVHNKLLETEMVCEICNFFTRRVSMLDEEYRVIRLMKRSGIDVVKLLNPEGDRS